MVIAFSRLAYWSWPRCLLLWGVMLGAAHATQAQTGAGADSSYQHPTHGASRPGSWAAAARTSLAAVPQQRQHLSFARQAIIPATLLTLAVLSTEKVDMLETDESLRQEVQEHVRLRTHLDNQLRNLPAYTSIGLSLAGVKGQHTTLNQALLFGLTYTINNTLTSNLKRLTHVERPMGNSFDSFPSQHTSAAFSAATLLHKEYGGQSIWYSVGGYSVATITGGLRIAKDNHWLSDVMAGAGVGIISTELAYWAYPWLHRQLLRSLGDRTVLLPAYSNGSVGATFVHVL